MPADRGSSLAASSDSMMARSAIGDCSASAPASVETRSLRSSAGTASAQGQERLSPPLLQYPQERVPSFNAYGLPGLVDMPTAEMAPDASFGATVSHFGTTTRATLLRRLRDRALSALADGTNAAALHLAFRS